VITILRQTVLASIASEKWVTFIMSRRSLEKTWTEEKEQHMTKSDQTMQNKYP
jgi:hypothetical protein